MPRLPYQPKQCSRRSGANKLVEKSGQAFRALLATYKNGLRSSGTVNKLCKFRIFDRCRRSCKGGPDTERAMTVDPKIEAKTRQLRNEIREAKSRTDVVRTTYSLSESARQAVHRLAYEHRVKINDIINVAVEDLLLRRRIPIDLTRPELREQLRSNRRGGTGGCSES